MNTCPSRARRALSAAGIALVASALAGCNPLSRPAPIKSTFLLAAPALQPVAQPKPGSLRVGSINVAAPFRGRNFVYRESELKYVNDFYTEFLVPPASMIGEATARALDRAHVFERVALPGAPSNADYVLDGFVEALYGDTRNAAKPTAEMTITYYLSRADEASPFWSKEYRKSVALSSSTPDQFATALSSAFGEIVAELARDLSAVEVPKR
jgi:ABC-type uncharacterized transport system auxiliary subunit